MSMHEFENLVEMSIRCLDQSPDAVNLDLRSIFWNLYEFQAQFDTGDTCLCVSEILLKYRFMYMLEVKEHPNYNANRDYFDKLPEGDFIFRKDGYFKNGSFYFTAGSRLWRRMSKEKKLTGGDSIPPQQMDIIEIVRLIVLEAEKQNDAKLISYWYPLLAVQVYPENEDEIEKLKRDPIIGEIRDVIYRTGAYRIEGSYGFLKHATEEEKEGNPFLVWWFSIGT